MFYGSKFQVECPTGSGDFMHLGQVAEELQHRLQHLFARDDFGRRACNAGSDKLDHDPNWREYVFFHEFFHGDTGSGLGASHQTGWTGLIAKMIHDSGVNCRLPHTPRTPGAAANHYFDDIFSRVAKKPRPYMGRRHSTARSIDARSDWNDEEDEEERKARERDDQEVLQYVNNRLKRAMSTSVKSDAEDTVGSDNEFEEEA